MRPTDPEQRHGEMRGSAGEACPAIPDWSKDSSVSWQIRQKFRSEADEVAGLCQRRSNRVWIWKAARKLGFRLVQNKKRQKGDDEKRLKD
jgi:hypothetical protein